jgi:hypothetical protein
MRNFSVLQAATRGTREERERDCLHCEMRGAEKCPVCKRLHCGVLTVNWCLSQRRRLRFKRLVLRGLREIVLD